MKVLMREKSGIMRRQALLAVALAAATLLVADQGAAFDIEADRGFGARLGFMWPTGDDDRAKFGSAIVGGGFYRGKVSPQLTIEAGVDLTQIQADGQADGKDYDYSSELIMGRFDTLHNVGGTSADMDVYLLVGGSWLAELTDEQ